MGKKKIFTDTEILECVEPQLREITKFVMDDIKEKSLSAIRDFYLDYNPTKYNRHYAMPFVLNTPKVKQMKDKIRLTFSFTGANYKLHMWKGKNVGFDGVFVQGYHGGPIYYVVEHSTTVGIIKEYKTEPAYRSVPSPWEEIRNYAVYIYNAKVFE